MNYVIMLGNDKDTERYGKPTIIHPFSESQKTKKELQDRIKSLPCDETRPVLIEDPFMISVFDMLYGNGELDLESTEAENMKSEIRTIIRDLEDLL